MATPKSPFIVIQEFLSPKQCEGIVDRLPFGIPQTDASGNVKMMWRHNDYADEVIFERFSTITSSITDYFGTKYRGTERMAYEWYPEGAGGIPQCENAEYLRKKWCRTRDRDFSCILFFSDYNTEVPFDTDYEVYGGKLEFIQHDFGFNPQRGTLIIFPSGPHFINSIARAFAGDLILARWHVAAALPYLHDPSDFPGDYTTWFNGLE